MPIDVGYLSAFIVGLLGGVHCVGMCGGIVAALSLSQLQTQARTITGPGGTAAGHNAGHNADRHPALRQLPLVLGYNLGRIASYSVAGALFGGIGALAVGGSGLHAMQTLLLIISALFMIALGLYLGGWWRGLARLEQAGGVIWRRIEPLGRHLLPVRSARQALLLGLVWGWLPCGLVYSVLIWSISTGDPLRGALLLLSFGLGTLPNLLAMGLFSSWLSGFTRKPRVRQAAGLLVASFGLWTLWQLLPTG